MKLQALVIAAALAAGSAFAAAPNSGAKGDAAATAAASTDTAATAPVKKSHKKVAKKHHASTHASARQHHATTHASAKQHQLHAKASHHGSTHAMGAGPSSPITDVRAPSRQARIDQAYADWQARQR